MHSFFLHLDPTFALITVNAKQYWADYNFLLADSFHSLFPSKLANRPANSTLQYISVIDFSHILFIQRLQKIAATKTIFYTKFVYLHWEKNVS